jgi:hypothetical protein
LLVDPAPREMQLLLVHRRFLTLFETIPNARSGPASRERVEGRHVSTLGSAACHMRPGGNDATEYHEMRP